MKKGILVASSLAFLGAGSKAMLDALGRCHNYGGLMSADDMEIAAGGLSNFGGGGGMSAYSGAGDPFLEFSGATGSFMDSIDEGKTFSMIITNANASARTLLFCPGLNASAAGLVTDGAFNDVSGAPGLSAEGSPGSIAALNAYIQRFPTIVAGFKVNTSNVAQQEQHITVQKENPFFTDRSFTINPSNYTSEVNPNTNLITVNRAIQFDHQTKVSYKVLGSTTVTFNIFFGASASLAKALRSKAAVAQANIQQGKFTGGI